MDYPPLFSSRLCPLSGWTTESGLPQNSVYAILQTRDGYIWFTTFDGLVRYDGVRFTLFNRGNTAGIISNRFSSLFEDREGCLWIGAEDRGLTRYKKGTFTSYASAEGLPDTTTDAIRQDHEGNILVFASGQMWRLKDESFSAIHRRQLWAVDSAGLHLFKDGKFTTYTTRDGLSSLNVLSVYEDQHGVDWIATREGMLNKLRDGSFTTYSVKWLRGKSISTVCEDRGGNIWIATAGGGLIRLKNGSPARYGAESTFAQVRIMSIYEDREGNLWLGTYKNGLYCMTRQIASLLSEQDGLSLNNIYPIYEDSKGSIWIGTWGKGLDRYKNGSFSNYSRKDGLAGHYISALCEDREGCLWIGTRDNGASRLKNGRFINYGSKQGLTDESIYVIYQSREGQMWFGTNNGLFRHRDGLFTHCRNDEGYYLPDQRVRAIHQDRAGNLWVGTLGGVVCFTDERHVTYTEASGLTSNNVRTIYEDSDGAIWIGTYDRGLNRALNGSLVGYTTRDGLFSDGVFQILEDSRGYFWMSCNQGIFRVKRSELNDFADGRIKSLSSVSYGKSDGLLNLECNGARQPSGWKTRDGKLWFPTQGGAVIIDPDAIPLNAHPPPIHIEQVSLDNKPVAFESDITILHGQSNLEIGYVGLSFIKPEQVRFKYIMEGQDSDWIEAGSRRKAYYSYLPPGTYIFKVRAANADGIWNTEVASIRIRVVPPFWRTWWFLSIVLLFGIGAIFIAYRRRVSGLERARATQEAFSRRLIESQEAERKRVAAELHDGLGQSLIIIKNHALISLSRPQDQGSALDNINEISAAASQAINEMKEIAYNLRPYQLDRLGLSKSIESMLKKAASSCSISLYMDIDPLEGVFAKAEEINFYRIVQECVNNIVKHSSATCASVIIKRDDQSVDMAIQDNGRGFGSETSSAPGWRKGGFGIVGISERARMLGGKLSVHSTPGGGTKVTLKLPLRERRDEYRDANCDSR